MPHDLIPVSAIAHPFELRRADYQVPAGLTIAEIIDAIQPDPLLREYGVVFLGEHRIPRELWYCVRPKPGALVSIRLLPRGGGALRIIATVALIAIATVATWYIGGIGGPLVGSLVGGAIMIGGTLAINTLLPPPLPKLSQNYGNDSPSYAITGQQNRMARWEKLPFLGGTFKITPPYAAQPWRDNVPNAVNFRGVFAIGHGPVHITAMRIGDTDLTQFSGVEMDFRRGYWSLTDRGGWDASTGVFPAGAEFGDTWTVTAAGTAGGGVYKVGQTITCNTLFDATTPAGWDLDQGKPYSLFPSDTNEESVSVDVKYGAPVVRTTTTGVDLAYVQIVFPRGLAHIQNNPPGKRSISTAVIRIEQAPVGSGAWASVLEYAVSGAQTTPLYWGHIWDTRNFGSQDANKQYDIRVTRLTADFDEDRNFGNLSWFALTTFGTALMPVPGVATVALRLIASGQLSGALESFNVDVTPIMRTWNGSTWAWTPSRSVAALYRHMIQHPTRQVPAPDAQVDLPRLQSWSGFCVDNDLYFDGVFEAKTSLLDALTDVARIGLAVPTLRDLKYSVIIDEPKTVPVRLFTPRNSWNYRGEMTHAPSPHAYRVGFVNAARNWAIEEVVVYDDGYDATNATRIERVEWVGITDRARVCKHARRDLVEQRLRREVHTIDTDFEYMVCERGDLVAAQYDAIAVGLGSMRIAGITDNGVTASAITLDSSAIMEADKSYGFRSRRVVDGAQRTDLYAVDTVAGEQVTLTFPVPIVLADAPAVGDLISFGEYGRETRRVLIRDIQPHNDESATLTLIDEAPGIHEAGTGTVPPWNPGITLPRQLPSPVVTAVASDDLVMLGVGGTSLTPRVIFTIQPIAVTDATVVVLFRPTATDGQWMTPTTVEQTPNSVSITGIASGESYDFRLGRTHPNYLSSLMAQLPGVLVVGRSNPPQGLQNMTLAPVAGGTQALIQWDPVRDVDVQFGGKIEFRHSVLPPEDATWGTSTSIGQAINGNQLHIQVPLKPGTYLARVYDIDGNRSETTGVASDTKQMSAPTYTAFPASPITEHPTFAGTKVNCEVAAGVLQLSAGNFDTVPDVDAMEDWDTGASGFAPSAVYHWAESIDFGSVSHARLTGIAKVEASSAELIDGSGGSEMWDAPDDVDGVDSAPIDVQIWGRLTDDDPAGTPTWGEARRIDCMEVVCRAVGQLEARLTTDSQSYNVLVFELSLYADHL